MPGHKDDTNSFVSLNAYMRLAMVRFRRRHGDKRQLSRIVHSILEEALITDGDEELARYVDAKRIVDAGKVGRKLERA